jgi:NitT/TauT family transport system ATP-binding protein
LARAFAVEPELLVLDEPFVSLDATLAERLRAELAELVARRPMTTILVTHNVEEAIGLADRLFLLRPPRVCSRTSRSKTRVAPIRRTNLLLSATRSRAESTKA